jgi:hypothetical protein
MDFMLNRERQEESLAAALNQPQSASRVQPVTFNGKGMSFPHRQAVE